MCSTGLTATRVNVGRLLDCLHAVVFDQGLLQGLTVLKERFCLGALNGRQLGHALIGLLGTDIMRKAVHLERHIATDRRAQPPSDRTLVTKQLVALTRHTARCELPSDQCPWGPLCEQMKNRLERVVRHAKRCKAVGKSCQVCRLHRHVSRLHRRPARAGLALKPGGIQKRADPELHRPRLGHAGCGLNPFLNPHSSRRCEVTAL